LFLQTPLRAFSSGVFFVNATAYIQEWRPISNATADCPLWSVLIATPLPALPPWRRVLSTPVRMIRSGVTVQMMPLLRAAVASR